MNEKEFAEKYLKKVQDILDFVLTSSASDFYIKKYKDLGIEAKNIKTYSDFLKIPLLTKTEILKTPLLERVFVPIDEVTRYNVSSGTTDINKPLITPQAKRAILSQNPNTPENLSEKLKVNKTLVLLPPSLAVKKIAKAKSPMIYADYQKMSLSAKIAKELGMDSIVTTPTILYLFIEKLKEIGFDFKQVKMISVGSEFCTQQKAKLFKEIFPNAYMRFRYGNSEIGTAVGFRCDELYDERPGLFHPSEEIMTQEIKTENGYSEEGQGELVVTTFFNRAFPLIRYQTGDLVEVTKTSCGCGSNKLLEIKGRAQTDMVKVSGAILHTQAIANAMDGLRYILEPYFQARVTERKRGSKILTHITLDVVPKKDFIGKLSEKEIATSIEEHLFLSVNKTLKDYINEGIFARLEINILKEAPLNAKSRNIIHTLE